MLVLFLVLSLVLVFGFYSVFFGFGLFLVFSLVLLLCFWCSVIFSALFAFDDCFRALF